MFKLIFIAVVAIVLHGCVVQTVDQQVFNEPTGGIGDATVVILGRRDSADEDTEPDFVECVGERISKRDPSIAVVAEPDFVNAMYPWFEPRTAPLQPASLRELMQHPLVARKMTELKTQYMIWINGSTERTDSSGSMSCAISPAGGGCFGFAHWTNEANYEAVIWDSKTLTEVGRVNASATGQSYMPAIIIPIPMIAPVQGTACKGLGDQLLSFLSNKY